MPIQIAEEGTQHCKPDRPPAWPLANDTEEMEWAFLILVSVISGTAWNRIEYIMILRSIHKMLIFTKPKQLYPPSSIGKQNNLGRYRDTTRYIYSTIIFTKRLIISKLQGMDRVVWSFFLLQVSNCLACPFLPYPCKPTLLVRRSHCVGWISTLCRC